MLMAPMRSIRLQPVVCFHFPHLHFCLHKMPDERDCTQCFPDRLGDLVGLLNKVESKACEVRDNLFDNNFMNSLDTFVTRMNPFKEEVKKISGAWNTATKTIQSTLDVISPFNHVISKINYVINYKVGG